jgi:predicted DsbA family dithiol-disulfide isomerase
MTNPTTALRIDIVSDVVCPWCFIGKRQLEQALERWRQAHPDADAPTIVWRPFQLNPGMPLEGMTRDDYLLGKFGRSDATAIYANVRRAARESGLSLNLEAIARQPSTLRPHALMQAAAAAGLQDTMAELLFTAYFIDGRDLTDATILQALGVEAGLDSATVASALQDESLLQSVADRGRTGARSRHRRRTLLHRQPEGGGERCAGCRAPARRLRTRSGDPITGRATRISRGRRP